MKFILGIIGLCVGFLVFSNMGGGTPLASSASGGAKHNQTHELLSYAKSHDNFESLAQAPHHTVVKVFSDSCGRCKRMEKTFPKFQKQRQDVVIHKVRIPEGRMSQEEFQEISTALDQFEICGVPHVVVFDHNEQVVAADRCGKKQGTSFLTQWIEKENRS